jgi:hypothetical protein
MISESQKKKKKRQETGETGIYNYGGRIREWRGPGRSKYRGVC